MTPKCARQGVTLIELLVAISLAGLVIGFAWGGWYLSAKQQMHRIREADKLREDWLRAREGRTLRGIVGGDHSAGDSMLFQ